MNSMRELCVNANMLSAVDIANVLYNVIIIFEVFFIGILHIMQSQNTTRPASRQPSVGMMNGINCHKHEVYSNNVYEYERMRDSHYLLPCNNRMVERLYICITLLLLLCFIRSVRRTMYAHNAQRCAFSPQRNR